MQPLTIMAVTFVACLTGMISLYIYLIPSGHNNPLNMQALYMQYKSKYNLKIGAAENDLRFGIFAYNYKKIYNHNQNKSASYKLGVNQFTHLTLAEFSALNLGYNKPTPAQKAQYTSSAPTNCTAEDLTLAVPDSIDWVAQGKVARVKDQGRCGSCWAFSAIGAIESVLAITTGVVNEFSEQQLVDCSTSYGNNGCNGGDMYLAFKYVADNGIVGEAAYPYTAVDGTCNVPKDIPTFHISGSRNVTANSSDALKTAVAKNPVSVAIEADTEAFQFYKSGVLTGDACGIELDHGVLAVGYGTQNGTDFWKVKNSWGPTWGDNGYILIERRAGDGPGTCGINIDSSYPTHYC